MQLEHEITTLSIPETAAALDTSPRTIVREWTRARAYLLRKLGPAEGLSEPAPEAKLSLRHPVRA